MARGRIRKLLLERRKHLRRRSRREARLMAGVRTGHASSLVTHTRDISLEGLSVEVPSLSARHFEPGRRLGVTLSLPGGPIWLEATAVDVRQAGRGGASGLIVGLKITMIGAEERARLRSFLKDPGLRPAP